MIIVSLDQTWPKVLEGVMTAERATLDTWPVRPNELAELDQFADVILGVYRYMFVSAYDIMTWHVETEEERAQAIREGATRDYLHVIFEGRRSQTWAFLIDCSCARPFKSWPVQYLDTPPLPDSDR